MNSKRFNRIIDNPHYKNSILHNTFSQKPYGFVDVGARGGIHSVVEPLAKHTSVLAFEPDCDECEKVQKKAENLNVWANLKAEPKGLYDNKGKQKLYLTYKATNSSLLPGNYPFLSRYNMIMFDQIGHTIVDTIRLDSILFEEKNICNYWGELIKLDTQGTEFEILQGAIKTLTERTVAIVCEVAFAEVYQNQKFFSDIELFLRQHGFSFYGFISSVLRSRKQIDKLREIGRERYIYADAVFFKDPLPGGVIEVNLTNRQTVALITSAILFEYFDFAIELSQQYLDRIEAVKIYELVHSLATYPPKKTYNELFKLIEQVKKYPEYTNVIVGNMIKSRFGYFDYDDIELSFFKR